jgi:hypothetical protein
VCSKQVNKPASVSSHPKFCEKENFAFKIMTRRRTPASRRQRQINCQKYDDSSVVVFVFLHLQDFCICADLIRHQSPLERHIFLLTAAEKASCFRYSPTYDVCIEEQVNRRRITSSLPSEVAAKSQPACKPTRNGKFIPVTCKPKEGPKQLIKPAGIMVTCNPGG